MTVKSMTTSIQTLLASDKAGELGGFAPIALRCALCEGFAGDDAIERAGALIRTMHRDQLIAYANVCETGRIADSLAEVDSLVDLIADVNATLKYIH